MFIPDTHPALPVDPIPQTSYTSLSICNHLAHRYTNGPHQDAPALLTSTVVAPLQGVSKPAAVAAAAAGAATPQEADKTPTLCLFERFERLTLATPSTAAPHTTTAGAGRGLFSAAPNSAMGSAGSTSIVSSADSEQRVRPGRRSVAFGTPSVLAYTPERSVEDEGGLCAEETPLWSNAGEAPGQSLQVPGAVATS